MPKTERERRLKTAAASLMDALLDDPYPKHHQAARPDQSSESSFVVGQAVEARSEAGSSVVSSHYGAPSWRRMVKPFALAIAKRVAECEDGPDAPRPGDSKPTAKDARLEAILITADGGGGGSVGDMESLTQNMMESLGLSDKDLGSLLLTTYAYLQPVDLPFAARTWRPLLLCAIHVAVGQVIKSPVRAEAATQKLLGHVRHWWPETQAHAAVEAFVARPEGAIPPTHEQLARLYFDLRDDGLRMAGEDPSIASQENSIFSASGSFPPAAPAASGSGGISGMSLLRKEGILDCREAIEAYEQMLRGVGDGPLDYSESSVGSSRSASFASFPGGYTSQLPFAARKSKTKISL